MQKLCGSFSPNLVRILRFSTAVSPPSDFLPSYLVTNCGFSPDKAAKAAKLIPRRVCSPDQPDSVIAFFKSHGFNDSRLKKLISAHPRALALSVEETLNPRFHTFHELGFTGDDLITLISTNPHVLRRSMENQVMPVLKLLKSVLGSHSCLMKCLRRTHWQIIDGNMQTIKQNISILKECGLSDHQIGIIVMKQPSIIAQNPESLNELISRVERLGMPRGSPNIHWALYAIYMVSEENLRLKVELFKGFGWSEDDFAKAFRKSPGFHTSSLKVLREKMEFLLKEACCSTCYIALHPELLTYSLEKRFIPRVAVLKVLKERRFNGGDHKLVTSIVMTNKEFFERYVAPYKEGTPELSELFSASL